MPTDGPDHTTSPKGRSRVEFQADNAQLVRSTGAIVSVMVLQGRSRVEFQADNAQLVRSTGAIVSVMVLQGPKYSPQKSRSLESGHRRHGVCIAIE